MREKFHIPKNVYLYDEGTKGLDFKQIKDFLKDKFGNIKIYLIKPRNKLVYTKGIIFDLLATIKAFEALEYSKYKDTCHIVITDRLFATLDEDGRPHIRASVYSWPSVISTSGIVEGPAKPKEYYLYKQKYTQLGIWDIEEARVKRKFKDRFIDYQSKQMTEVLKGYIAQALFFYILGEPFCKQRNCRLFNAHWQEEGILAQITSGQFCFKHSRILGALRKKL